MCKHKHAKPDKAGLIEEFRDTASLEQRIARSKEKIEKHHSKWNIFLEQFELIIADDL